MSQPVIATSVPTPFGVAAFDWWLAQVKHALPPTIFFFVGFNLILWTKRLILEDQGVVFSGFFIATAAALIHQAVSPAEVRKAKIEFRPPQPGAMNYSQILEFP
jgi:hypothetical protein